MSDGELKDRRITISVTDPTYKKIKHTARKCGISKAAVVNAYIESCHNALELLGEVKWVREQRLFKGLDEEQLLKKFFSFHHIITSLENMEELQERYQDLKQVLLDRDHDGGTENEQERAL